MPTPEDIAREATTQALQAVETQQQQQRAKQEAVDQAVNVALLAERVRTIDPRLESMEGVLRSIQGVQQQILLNLQAADGRMGLIEQRGEFTAKHIQAVHTSVGLLDERVANIERGTTEAASRGTRALQQKSISTLKEVAPIIVATGSAIASVVAAIAVIWHSPSAASAAPPAQPPAAVAPKPSHAGE